MTNTSVTLTETGIEDAVNEGGPYDSARNKMLALDYATQEQDMKVIAGQADYALGSVHAITRDGTLLIASASGSQLAAYAWGAANVILVAGAQKLVPTLEAARDRIHQHSLKLEDARAQAAYGQHSYSERSWRSSRNSRAASTSSSSVSRSASNPARYASTATARVGTPAAQLRPAARVRRRSRPGGGGRGCGG
jgi:hypothetical protein